MACFCFTGFVRMFASVSRLLIKCPFTSPVLGLHCHLMVIFKHPFHRKAGKCIDGGIPVPKKLITH